MKSPSTASSSLHNSFHHLHLIALVASALVAAGICARADVNNLPPGYSIEIISANVDASGISQLAFKPGDVTHVYAVHSQGSNSRVSRYDYDPVTGILSNEFAPIDNADNKEMIGLGFHGTNMYVTFDYRGSRTIRPGDGRIARFMDPEGDGFYQVRHDFVHSVNKGDHDLDQIQFKGDSLYVGIGGVGRKGDPSDENLYSMTVARIVDINEVVTDPAQIGPDFKGPINYLASPSEWTNFAGGGGLLRCFASGFRNPFGIAFDPDGDLWVSVNGNSDVGYFSDDFLYKKVQLGDEGEFPPPEFGFSKYISGHPITNLCNFGVSPSPGGFDFILDGPDAGKVLLGRLGATRTNSLGRDLLLIDPDTGAFEQIYQFSTSTSAYAISDVLRDPFGRFLVADIGHNNIWLLRGPAAQPKLNASLDGPTLRLSWPLTAVEYELEETGDPTKASWQVSDAPNAIGTHEISTELRLTNSARFFRLRQ